MAIPGVNDDRKLLDLLVSQQIRTVPFNSFAALDYAYGAPVDPNRGGNCALHAVLLLQGLQKTWPDISACCLLAQDQLHIVVICKINNREYLLDTSSVLPVEAFLIPAEGSEPFETIGYSSSGTDPVMRLKVERVNNNNVTLTRQKSGTNNPKKRHKFDLSGPAIDPMKLLRAPDYVKAVVCADDLLVNRVFSQEWGFITYFRIISEGIDYLLSSPPDAKRKVGDVADYDPVLSAFLRHTGYTRKQLECETSLAINRLFPVRKSAINVVND